MQKSHEAAAGPWYAGEYRSAIARAKRALLAAEVPWSRTTGRYTAFSDTQKITVGVRVTRVGCSETVALHAFAGRYGSREASRELQARALEVVRAAGLPFDDRGWLECGRAARAAIAKAASNA